MDREPPQSPPGACEPGWPFRGVTPDWADEAEWERMCAARGDEPEPPDPDEDFGDPGQGAPADWEEVPAEMSAARAAEYAAWKARLVAAGLDGWAHRRGDPPVPGIPSGPAAEFGQGQPLDAAAPSTVVSGLADEASGENRAFAGVSDDQLMGLIGARQRLAARQQWELLTAVAEFIRRRPEPVGPADPADPAGMPAVWGEHAAGELAAQLHLAGVAADALLGLAHDLAARLPLTGAALRDGIIDLDKARIIALHCSPLTAEEARAAEAIVLSQDTAAEMTRGMIRDRIARAVMEVNPGAAARRRERAAKDKRVEVIAEASGNCQIAGRELPAAAALAASENLTIRAQELRRAGISGGIDDLRALAYLEKLGALNPLEGITGDGTADGPGDGGGPDGGPGPGPGGPGPGGPGRPGGGAGTAPGQESPGRASPGLAARVNLTVPLATLLGLADRPGVMSRIGPVDPAQARDLAAAAARDARSAWCLTITGPDRRPVAHACGRPPARAGPVCIPGDDYGPPGSGTIWLDIAALTGTPGAGTGPGAARGLVFEPESLAGPCDHQHQGAGHDPGVKLRHLTGILNACCTFPPCRRPEAQCDYEHSTPYEQGGRTCLCEAGPVCRRNHRGKQAPGWHLEHAGTRGWFRWTTPSGRSYLSRPTQYPD